MNVTGREEEILWTWKRFVDISRMAAKFLLVKSIGYLATDIMHSKILRMTILGFRAKYIGFVER